MTLEVKWHTNELPTFGDRYWAIWECGAGVADARYHPDRGWSDDRGQSRPAPWAWAHKEIPNAPYREVTLGNPPTRTVDPLAISAEDVRRRIVEANSA